MTGISPYRFVKRGAPQPNAAWYVPVFPYETIPFEVLGTGIPNARQFSIIAEPPPVYSPTVTVVGVGQQTGQFALTPLRANQGL